MNKNYNFSTVTESGNVIKELNTPFNEIMKILQELKISYEYNIPAQTIKINGVDCTETFLKVYFVFKEKLSKAEQLLKQLLDYQELFEANLECSDYTWNDIKNIYSHVEEFLNIK